MNLGKFEGVVVAKWLQHSGNDRDMELLEDFVYVDPDGKRWLAPSGSVVNGASIPEPLWNIIGSPFVGDYRRASVIHDVACVEKEEPHKAVHLMFYHAMRADQVGWVQANIMYQAVKRFGPRWNIAERDISVGVSSVNNSNIFEWVNAVEKAAKQINQSQGLEAVEERAKVLLSQRKAEVAEDTPKAATSKDGQRVSKVRVINRDTDEPSSLQGIFHSMSTTIPLPVRNHFIGHKSLHDLRQQAGIDRSEELPAASSARESKDLSLQGAAGVDELEETLHLRLSREERVQMLDQAMLLLADNYVHLPLKEAMYAVNPTQSLRLFREQTLQTETELISTVQFHRRLAKIFLSTRDLHTNYFLPTPFSQLTAFLPFLVEDFFDEVETQDQRRFLVTRVFTGFDAPGFEPGVEILRWSGVAIDRAVDINGDRFAGSNPEARRARGLETLTVRSLVQSLPPEEDFVIIEFRDYAGDIRELRVEWQIFRPDTAGLAAIGDLEQKAALAQGIDLEQRLVRFAKQVLFAPESVMEAEKMAHIEKASAQQGLTSIMPNVLTARPVTTDFGEFGYVRIRTFSVQNADRFVEEFLRLVTQLPQSGLVIDVRGNGGGLILAGEQLLQVLTPRRIEPTLFQMRNTPINRQLVEVVSFLREWRASMRQAVRTGAIYTKGFPITSPSKANEIGQQYYGPIVLITDGLCYSTTDIFAAGFQDHAIGTILGVDNNTGAGGANVWEHGLLSDLLSGADSPYEPLPGGSNMRVSMRRTIRVGINKGTVLEDLGVVPNQLYRMTRDDLLNDNVDLINEAGRLLSQQTARALNVEISGESNGEIELEVKTTNIERLDFYIGSRPLGSVEVMNNLTQIALDTGESSSVLIEGFSDDQLVASKRVALS